MLSIVALAGLIFAYSYRQGRATLRVNQRETARRNQEIQQSVIENLNAQPLLKTWNQEPSVMERFREKLTNNKELNIRNSMITQAFARATVLITNGAQVAVLVAGGLAVIWSNGEALTPAGLMAFYVLLLRLYGPGRLFAGAFQTLTLSADGLDKFSAVLNRKAEADPPNAVTLGPLREAIRFERLGYAPTKGKSVLKDLDVEIAPEDRVRRADRCRQGREHAAPAPGGRPDRGQGHLGRRGPGAGDAAVGPRADRRAAAGHVHPEPDDLRQHPGRPSAAAPR